LGPLRIERLTPAMVDRFVDQRYQDEGTMRHRPCLARLLWRS
jgi:hypothetical protein